MSGKPKAQWHRGSDTPEYHVWEQIIQRCTNPGRETNG